MITLCARLSANGFCTSVRCTRTSQIIWYSQVRQFSIDEDVLKVHNTIIHEWETQIHMLHVHSHAFQKRFCVMFRWVLWMISPYSYKHALMADFIVFFWKWFYQNSWKILSLPFRINCGFSMVVHQPISLSMFTTIWMQFLMWDGLSVVVLVRWPSRSLDLSNLDFVYCGSMLVVILLMSHFCVCALTRHFRTYIPVRNMFVLVITS